MTPDFKKLMTDAGLPITENLAKQQWENQLDEQDITIENNSPFSPFWRTIKALITLPVVSLFEWVAQSLFPDLFIMLAGRDALISLHGPSRNVFVFDAIKARGILKLQRTETAGVLSLPVGSLVESDSISGNIYQLTLLDSAVFKEDESTIQVLVEAVVAGQGHNLPTSSYYKLVTPIDGVSVTNEADWLIVPGANEENTEAYRNRIRNVFGTAAKWHINTVYKAIISDFGIPINNIEIVNGAPRGAGTANAYIYLNVGAVSSALLTVINQHIREKGHHGHGDDFMVYVIPTNNIDAIATYKLHANSNDISTDIENFIKAAFRLNDSYQPTRTLPQSTFSMSVLATELHQQFPELSSITFDITDIENGLWLPHLNSLLVQNG
jgi:hypothetical protein